MTKPTELGRMNLAGERQRYTIMAHNGRHFIMTVQRDGDPGPQAAQ